MVKEKAKDQNYAMSKQLFSRAETAERLGQQILRDALEAGWLYPRARKASRGRSKNAKLVFAGVDIEAVEARILKGEYPEKPKPNWFGEKPAEPA